MQSADPPTSTSDRSIRPDSPSNTRSLAVLSASRAAASEESPWPTPSSTTSPSPIRPKTTPSTVTEAELTRWIRPRNYLFRVPDPVAVDAVVGPVGPHAARERHVPAGGAPVAELLEGATEAEVGVVV